MHPNRTQRLRALKSYLNEWARDYLGAVNVQHRSFWSIIPAVLAVCVLSCAAAQTPGQIFEQLEELEVPDADPEIIQYTLDNRRAPPNAADISLDFGDINLLGVEDMAKGRLEAIWSEFRGQTITVLDLYQFRDQVKDAYVKADFPFSRVVIPPQDIGPDGVVTIQVTEAFVDRIIIRSANSEEYSALRKVCAYATRLIGKGNLDREFDACARRRIDAEKRHLSLTQLDRVMLLINDLPGIQATAVPTTGDEEIEGAIDLIVRLQRRDAYGLDIFANNRQADIVGPGLMGISGRVKSYTRFGDTTEISYLNSFDMDGSLDDQGVTTFDGDTNERRTVQLLHRHFWGDRGGEIGVQYLFSHTEPGDELAVLDFSGDQHRGEISYRHPFIRQQAHSLWIGANFAYTDSDADVSSGSVVISDDRIRTFGLKATHLWRGQGGRRSIGRRGDYLLTDIELRQGVDFLDASKEGDQELSRFDAVPDFTKIQGTVRARRIIRDNFRFNSLVAFQYATDPVLAPEEFAVGGSNISRAFDPAELTGDRGAGVLGELERVFAISPFGWEATFRPYVYGDYGYVANIVEQGSDNAELISAGGGFRLNTARNSEFHFEVGVPVNQPLGRTGQEHARFFLSFRKSY
ncbi:MAG: ShlB/FhaC/HecB family hemolysin secretion/activation protein [Pseudomonadota bacterium]